MEFTQKHHEAAILIAEDDLSHAEIANRVGVVERTIYLWKNDEGFSKLIQRYVKEYARRIFNRGIALKHKRVAVLDDIHSRLQKVFKERGESEEMQAIPGGKTGLLVKQIKGIGRGEDFQTVEEYAVDTGAIRELRGLQQQVAEDLGQRVNKVEHMGADGGPIVVSDAKSKLLTKLSSGSSADASASGESGKDSESN